MKNLYCVFSRGLVLACALTLLCGGVAFAQTNIITGNDTQKILQIASNYGPAELSTSGNGNPLIGGSMDGINYTVRFTGCNNGANCTELWFWTYWQGNQGLSVSQINKWNADEFFGKMYIDSDGDLVVEMFVNLSHGVVAETLDDDFDWWNIVLNNVKDTVR